MELVPATARLGDPYDPADCRLALDRSTPVPLWSQIADYLATAIGRGEVSPGQPLGSQVDLAHRFNVTRSTIRRALADLDSRQLISRSRGNRIHW